MVVSIHEHLEKLARGGGLVNTVKVACSLPRPLTLLTKFVSKQVSVTSVHDENVHN